MHGSGLGNRDMVLVPLSRYTPRLFNHADAARPAIK